MVQRYMPIKEYEKPPQVISSSIKNYQVDVPTALKEVIFKFNMHLDSNYIRENVRVEDQHGSSVESRVVYKAEDATITVIFQRSLSPYTTYTIHLHGDSNLDDTYLEEKDFEFDPSGVTGIRNVFGKPMWGVYSLTFTTIKSATLPAPSNVYPEDGITVTEQPGFKWEPVEGAAKYQLQVSKFNTMSPVFWPVPEFKIMTGPYVPNPPFEEGTYSWRVRAIDAKGNQGEWSEIQSFYLDLSIDNPVVEEDGLPPVLRSQYIDLLKSFPTQDYTNMSTNLSYISFTVSGTVNPEDVLVEMFGESIFGEEADHGELSGSLEVVPQADGTTLIVYHLFPI